MLDRSAVKQFAYQKYYTCLLKSVKSLQASFNLNLESVDLNTEINFVRIRSTSASVVFLISENLKATSRSLPRNPSQTLLDSELSIGTWLDQ